MPKQVIETVYKQSTNFIFCKKVVTHKKYATNLTGRQGQTSHPKWRRSVCQERKVGDIYLHVYVCIINWIITNVPCQIKWIYYR